ncbi:MAG: DNA (cytosine-5-)-methyltransferase [Oscillospiraceae bacterium]|nr:DNA (cytosine-5-)-methyltransferase [Candidatus Ruminococcus equi]
MKGKLRCASFFAGVGGIDKGFEMTNEFETIYANEIDEYPVKTFELNFNINVDCRDINFVKEKEIPDFDVLLAGFPCQAFSVAGYRKGFDDEKGRGILFFQLIRIIHEKQPKIVFLENVKNLVGHDNGNTFSVIIDELKKENYYIKFAVLNAMEYGNIPQNRERIYILAFKDRDVYQRFNFPMPIKLNTTIFDVIDFDKKVDDKYYYTKGKYKGEIYEKLVEAMKDEKAVYQWRRKYVRKNKRGVIPTLTANQGEGGHNVCIIKTPYGIRKMTPHECFNAQGFPKDFKLPNNMSDARLYKQAGNSVCVSVIYRIAQEILRAL